VLRDMLGQLLVRSRQLWEIQWGHLGGLLR